MTPEDEVKKEERDDLLKNTLADWIRDVKERPYTHRLAEQFAVVRISFLESSLASERAKRERLEVDAERFARFYCHHVIQYSQPLQRFVCESCSAQGWAKERIEHGKDCNFIRAHNFLAALAPPKEEGSHE